MLDVEFIMKNKALILFSILLSLTFKGLAQEPQFGHNPIALLRQLKVIKLVEDSTYASTLQHDPIATRISSQNAYWHYFYTYLDSARVEEELDSTLIFTEAVEVHYFNHDQFVDSSFYINESPDSTGMDTTQILHFYYDHLGQLVRKQEITHWQKKILTQYDFYWAGNRLDSVFKYSTMMPGTFGPSYHDSLVLIEKQRVIYDSIGRKIRKENFARQWSDVIETYNYPSNRSLVTTTAPYHPISGCIMDPSISLSPQLIIEYNELGLVRRVSGYFRRKKEGESWENGEGYTYQLSYAIDGEN